jgi:hypothetical protein
VYGAKSSKREISKKTYEKKPPYRNFGRTKARKIKILKILYYEENNFGKQKS